MESAVSSAAVRARFNGASLLRARKPDAISTTGSTLTRFNGASLLRARKHDWYTFCVKVGTELQWGLTLTSKETRQFISDRGIDMTASMGPHSYEQGNMAFWLAGSSRESRLQWGLTLTSKET